MANGTVGDHPVTDIIIHGKLTWSARADRLVCEIVQFGGREQLEREIDAWHPRGPADLESMLQTIRDGLRAEATTRGWETGPDTAPRTIAGAAVVLWPPVDQRHHPTSACRQEVAGKTLGPAGGLAICQYPGETGYYLFYCDASWQAVTDTYHDTFDGVKAQAEFEYAGTSAAWEPPA